MKQTVLLTYFATLLIVSKDGFVSALEPDLLRGYDPFWEYHYTYTVYRERLPSAEEVAEDSSLSEGSPVLQQDIEEGRFSGWIRGLTSDSCIEIPKVEGGMYDTIITRQDILRLPYIPIEDAQPQISGWHIYSKPKCQGEPLVTKDMSSLGYTYKAANVWSAWDMDIDENQALLEQMQNNPHPVVLFDTINTDPTMQWNHGSSQGSSNANPGSSDKLEGSPFSPSLEAGEEEIAMSFRPIFKTNLNIGWRYTDATIPELRFPRTYTKAEAVLLYKPAFGVFNPFELEHDRKSYRHENFVDQDSRNWCYHTFGNPIGYGTLQYEYKVKPNLQDSKYQIVGILFYKDADCKILQYEGETSPAVYPVDRGTSVFNADTYERRWTFDKESDITKYARSYHLIFAETSIDNSGHGSVTQNGVIFNW